MERPTMIRAGQSRISEADWALGVDRSTSPSPAIRGQAQGREGWTGSSDGQGLATFLGWFSVGLGTMQIVAPRRMTRLIGLRPTSTTSTIMRVMGLREIAHGTGILANPSSKEWVGSRVGGDILDLAALGVALTQAERPERTLLAAAAVLGVGALDLLGTETLAESRKVPRPEIMDQPGTHVQKSITVEQPIAEVYEFWRDFTRFPSFMDHVEQVEMLGPGRSRWRAEGPMGTSAEWEAETLEERPNELISWRSVGNADVYNAGTVRFREAPAGRGTIVTVEMQYAPPGGTIGAALLKLFRKEPNQQVGDDLRRFKQIMETGEVVASDASLLDRASAAQPPNWPVRR